MNTDDRHFTLDELAVLVDLPRRTVRFYLQQGLVDRPDGLGRGAHYTRRHAEQLLTVKKWRDAGLSLERIGELVAGQEAPVPARPIRPGQVEVWSRVHLADGIELQVEPGRAGLTPEQVRALICAVSEAYRALTAGKEPS